MPEAQEPTAGTLPDEYKRCFHCGYDLTGTIDAGERACPECGRSFTIDDLWKHGSNPRGMPKSLPPEEPRISGKVLVIITAVILGLIFIAWIIAVITIRE